MYPGKRWVCSDPEECMRVKRVLQEDLAKQLDLNARLVGLVKELQRQIAVLEHKDGKRQERGTEEGTLP